MKLFLNIIFFLFLLPNIAFSEIRYFYCTSNYEATHGNDYLKNLGTIQKFGIEINDKNFKIFSKELGNYEISLIEEGKGFESGLWVSPDVNRFFTNVFQSNWVNKGLSGSYSEIEFDNITNEIYVGIHSWIHYSCKDCVGPKPFAGVPTEDNNNFIFYLYNGKCSQLE
jgi:hypothetical protein